MTVLSWPWRMARPRRRTAATRRLGAARRRARPARRTYPDPFFADPAVVEDDARRLARRGSSARPV
ncbi:MAG: hypothetical protein ACRDOA_16105 [Streptosporangiaceae bacterium]